MDHETKSTGTFRAWLEAGDFRDHLPKRPTLIQILSALETAWGLEARKFSDAAGSIGVEAELREGGRTRMRQFRYGDPELEVDPATGEAKWTIDCRWEDVYHMEGFGYDRSSLESIQVGPTVKTPLRGCPVPPFHGSGEEKTVTWWSYEGDIDVLREAVQKLHGANSTVRELLEADTPKD